MKLKTLLLLALMVLASTNLQASTHVRSYHHKNGSHFYSHRRSTRDHRRLNNYSSKGNINPYTGKVGRKKIR